MGSKVVFDRKQAARDARERIQKAKEQKESERKPGRTFEDNTSVAIRERKEDLESVVLFIAPTNSGKTYFGLQQLFEDFERSPEEIHAYSAPLRLLAYEVYKKMADRFGAENVGFVTGEESINPDAHLLATTVEMAPTSGGSILVDEAHWLTDPERGASWTKILVEGDYRNMYVATAAEAVPIITRLLRDTQRIEERVFERKTGIVYGGRIELYNVPAKSAVVCFSRRSVYSVAKEVERSGLRVGVLYGALPLPVRKRQLEAYERGELDIIVTTDVIGHGINLPIDNVVFTDVEKYDGSEVRNLHVWEGAQIAGRAGRFGLSEKGTVYLANAFDKKPAGDRPSDSSGSKKKVSDDEKAKQRLKAKLVTDSVRSAAGKSGTGLVIETAPIRPRLTDLGLDRDGGTGEVLKIPHAIACWKKKVVELNDSRGISPASLINALAITQKFFEIAGVDEQSDEKPVELPEIQVSDLWQVANGAYDVKNGVVEAALRHLVLPKKLRPAGLLPYLAFDEGVMKVVDDETSSLLSLEAASQKVGEFKMLFIMFSELGVLSPHMVFEYEERLNECIIQKLIERDEKHRVEPKL